MHRDGLKRYYIHRYRVDRQMCIQRNSLAHPISVYMHVVWLKIPSGLQFQSYKRVTLNKLDQSSGGLVARICRYMLCSLSPSAPVLLRTRGGAPNGNTTVSASNPSTHSSHPAWPILRNDIGEEFLRGRDSTSQRSETPHGRVAVSEDVASADFSGARHSSSFGPNGTERESCCRSHRPTSKKNERREKRCKELEPKRSAEATSSLYDARTP